MTPAGLLNILAFHQGRDHGIGATALAQVAGVTERKLRDLVSALREEGIAICATPETGYYMAVTPAELEESCKFLHQRAMRSLVLASRMQQISLPDLLGQLKLTHA